MAEPERLGPYAPFGKWIRERREAAKLNSQPAAVLRARQKKLALVNQGKLSHLERGMNGNPEPELLAQLATLYGIPYATVVDRWIAARYGTATDDTMSDLTRHGRTGQMDSRLSQGESDVPATDDSADREIRELRRQIEEYKAVLEQVENAASTLATAIAAGSEIGTTRRTQSKTGRRHRKAG